MSGFNQNILSFSGEENLTDVQSQAIGWAEHFQSGKGTAEDRQKFEDWLAADKGNAQAYGALQQWWGDMDYVAASDQDLENDLDRYADNNFANNNNQTGQGILSQLTSRRMFGGLAASLLAAVLLWQVTGPNEGVPKTRYETAMGELKTVELPDGTKITLAGRSTLDVYFSEKGRSAELVNGQAYFDVASDKSNAFIVKIGKTNVRVVGTKFDIQRGGDDVRVSVVEGLVEVTENMSIASPKRLKAGEQVFASLSGDVGSVKTFKQETDISWRVGRLEYINTPLTRVINEVNRYRNNKIILDDPSLANYPITISLAFDQTDGLLTGLEQTGVAHIVQRYGKTIIESINSIK